MGDPEGVKHADWSPSRRDHESLVNWLSPWRSVAFVGCSGMDYGCRAGRVGAKKFRAYGCKIDILRLPIDALRAHC